ncbi:hypothetical protein ES708_17099 [subsurface metagenome]
MWNCDNCGKCCIEYINQIRFQNDENLLMLFEESSDLQQLSQFHMYFQFLFSIC